MNEQMGLFEVVTEPLNEESDVQDVQFKPAGFISWDAVKEWTGYTPEQFYLAEWTGDDSMSPAVDDE